MTMLNQLAEFGLQDLLIRRLTTPGGLPAPTIAPELMGTLVLESDRVEYSYLKGERRCAAIGIVAAGGAGNISKIRLANPAGSRIITVVEQIAVEPGASRVNGILTFTAAALPSAVGASITDTRWHSPTVIRRPVSQVSQVADVSVVAGDTIFRLPASLYNTFDLKLVLGPGWSLNLQCVTDNVALNLASFRWYEREAQPGEL